MQKNAKRHVYKKGILLSRKWHCYKTTTQSNNRNTLFTGITFLHSESTTLRYYCRDLVYSNRLSGSPALLPVEILTGHPPPPGACGSKEETPVHYRRRLREPFIHRTNHTVWRRRSEKKVREKKSAKSKFFCDSAFWTRKNNSDISSGVLRRFGIFFEKKHRKSNTIQCQVINPWVWIDGLWMEVWGGIPIPASSSRPPRPVVVSSADVEWGELLLARLRCVMLVSDQSRCIRCHRRRRCCCY